MSGQVPEQGRTAFHELTPDAVIGIVERALGVRCTNLFRPLNSYINRVYELEREDGGGLVAKFYRPGRWSREALLDEHDFMRELVASEVPVIAPLPLLAGGTLGCDEGMHFAVYPKKSGRTFDEYTDEQWLELGRLLGRVHTVGAAPAPARPDHDGAGPLDARPGRLPPRRRLRPARPRRAVPRPGRHLHRGGRPRCSAASS